MGETGADNMERGNRPQMGPEGRFQKALSRMKESFSAAKKDITKPPQGLRKLTPAYEGGVVDSSPNVFSKPETAPTVFKVQAPPQRETENPTPDESITEEATTVFTPKPSKSLDVEVSGGPNDGAPIKKDGLLKRLRRGLLGTKAGRITLAAIATLGIGGAYGSTKFGGEGDTQPGQNTSQNRTSPDASNPVINPPINKEVIPYKGFGITEGQTTIPVSEIKFNTPVKGDVVAGVNARPASAEEIDSFTKSKNSLDVRGAIESREIPVLPILFPGVISKGEKISIESQIVQPQLTVGAGKEVPFALQMQVSRFIGTLNFEKAGTPFKLMPKGVDHFEVFQEKLGVGEKNRPFFYFLVRIDNTLITFTIDGEQMMYKNIAWSENLKNATIVPEGPDLNRIRANELPKDYKGLIFSPESTLFNTDADNIKIGITAHARDLTTGLSVAPAVVFEKDSSGQYLLPPSKQQ